MLCVQAVSLFAPQFLGSRLTSAADPISEKVAAIPAALPVLEITGSEKMSPSWEFKSGATMAEVGPTADEFVGQAAKNSALQLSGKGAYVRIADAPGSRQFDFTNGDSMTLEAWVRPDRLASGANVYIVGKGRTFEQGERENQNYALRLQGVGGSEARVNFLFATPDPSVPLKFDYHRWTSDLGFGIDGGWHHVAVTYRFDSPDSIVAVVDGEKSKGKWDMAGSTKVAPINDNDSIWVGSSRGGDPGNSFAGALDDVRIYREIVPVETLASRRKPIVHTPDFPNVFDARRVTITLHPELTSHTRLPAVAPPAEFTFSSSHMAWHRLPLHYLSGGIRSSWKGPLLLRAYCETTTDSGEMELLIRSPGLARLWIDGNVAVTTPAHKLFPDAHNPFIVYEPDNPWLHVPRISDQETRVPVRLEAGKHRLILEQIVGAKGVRCETGDTTVAIRRGDELFTIIGPEAHSLPLSDEGWESQHQRLEQELAKLDREELHRTSAAEEEFWNKRHAAAKAWADSQSPIDVPAKVESLPESNIVDRFLNAKVAAAGLAQDIPAVDADFVRRIYLDTLGIVPTAEETRAYVSDTSSDKRTVLVKRLLSDDRWADHWTSYWQDVLAENPSILKPTLNNTGPFRWWIYDALRENKSMDRFVTELIRMEGDKLGGGAAGFGIASENDVPMAAKAHILTGAFLGVDMKCARCHDSPYQPWTQRELFGLAAMLENKPIKVPASSSVPKQFFERKKGDSPITLSIFPGDEIAPDWPLTELNGEQPVADELGRNDSQRERLAVLITHPRNERFAQIIVNRLWQRLFGWGLVDKLDDWYDPAERNPELLRALARDFTAHGYDFKHTAELILTSRAYARVAQDGATVDAKIAFTSPWIRRLTAEQIVDSLHAAVGLQPATEELTFDPAGQQHDDAFINLGQARRAWQLTSLSNERDRPSLALPQAAVIVECLEAFGWRGSRQEPTSARETAPNMVMPGVIANGSMTVRLSRLSEQHAFTRIALEASSPEEFVKTAFISILNREPNAEELLTFARALAPGFEQRIATLALPPAKPKPSRGFVDWANHFDPKANKLMREIENEVAAGPEPTARLTPQWREQAEDALWAIMNSPEFQFVR
ncbi:MAG: DUF1553 domain-containing protein [Pirellulales bacterium]